MGTEQRLETRHWIKDKVAESISLDMESLARYLDKFPFLWIATMAFSDTEVRPEFFFLTVFSCSKDNCTEGVIITLSLRRELAQMNKAGVI